jgi:hypothetical protein
MILFSKDRLQVSKMKKKLIFIFLFVGGYSYLASSQESKISYGLFVETIYRLNQLESSPAFFDEVTSRNSFGYGLGVNAYWRIRDRFWFRASPGIGYEKEVLKYPLQTINIGIISLRLPLHVVYQFSKSARIRLVGGVSPLYGILGGESNHSFRKFDLTADIGFSFPVSIGNLQVWPEVKYSQSMVNAVANNEGVFMASYDSYYRNKVSLLISFTKK